MKLPSWPETGMSRCEGALRNGRNCSAPDWQQPAFEWVATVLARPGPPSPRLRVLLAVVMPRTMTVPQAAEALGIPASTLYQAIRENRAAHLHPIRIGNTTRIPTSVVDRLTNPKDTNMNHPKVMPA